MSALIKKITLLTHSAHRFSRKRTINVISSSILTNNVCSAKTCCSHMMTSSNGTVSRVTGPLWGESTGHRWIPITKASDAELCCFLWSAPLLSFSGRIHCGFHTNSGIVWRQPTVDNWHGHVVHVDGGLPLCRNAGVSGEGLAPTSAGLILHFYRGTCCHRVSSERNYSGGGEFKINQLVLFFTSCQNTLGPQIGNVPVTFPEGYN